MQLKAARRGHDDATQVQMLSPDGPAGDVHAAQQRAGVSLSSGVGMSGDAYEQNANAVADAVVAGQSAEGLLEDCPIDWMCEGAADNADSYGILALDGV